MAKDMRCIHRSRLTKLSMKLTWCHLSSKIKAAENKAVKGVVKLAQPAEALQSSPKLHCGSLAEPWKNTINMLVTIHTMRNIIKTWTLTKSWIDLSTNTEWRTKELRQRLVIWKKDWLSARATELDDANLPARLSHLIQRASKITMGKTSLAWKAVQTRARKQETLKTHTDIKCLLKGDVARYRCIKLFEWYFIGLKHRPSGWCNLANSTLF